MTFHVAHQIKNFKIVYSTNVRRCSSQQHNIYYLPYLRVNSAILWKSLGQTFGNVS